MTSGTSRSRAASNRAIAAIAAKCERGQHLLARLAAGRTRLLHIRAHGAKLLILALAGVTIVFVDGHGVSPLHARDQDGLVAVFDPGGIGLIRVQVQIHGEIRADTDQYVFEDYRARALGAHAD